MRGAIDARGGGRVMIDVGEVDFMSSRGLATLLEAREHAGAREVTLSLARPTRHFERVLDMAGLVAVFTVDRA